MIHFDTNFLIQATIIGSPSHTQFKAWATAQEDFNVSTVA